MAYYYVVDQSDVLEASFVCGILSAMSQVYCSTYVRDDISKTMPDPYGNSASEENIFYTDSRFLHDLG
jgi:hypothetical protein